MRSIHLAAVIPVQRDPAALHGGDPVFAGIHVLLAGQQDKAWKAGTSPAMTAVKRDRKPL
jgi:hypothetical protein